jgi:predicted RNA-binding Zn-ribbon protein involved in translation (DUF1610 family)
MVECPTCGAPIGPDELLKIADERAQSHLEGGDSFDGGEVYASCPRCGEEMVLQTEGYTEVQRVAVVSKAVLLR